MSQAALSHPHQIFLQRIMASTVLTDREARDLHHQVTCGITKAKSDEQQQQRLRRRQNNGGGEFEHFLGTINATLVPMTEFEIRTTVLEHRVVSEPSNAEYSSMDDNTNTTRYHAFVNLSPDGPAKVFGAARSKSPHEIAFLRFIIEHLVDAGNAADVDRGRDDIVAGCTAMLSRMEILNLRHELKGPHKLSGTQTEEAIQKFEEEKWLVPCIKGMGYSEDDGQGEDDDESEGRRSSESGRKKRMRRGGNPDDSITMLQIGPRTYMELSDLLKDLGLQRMPQFIIHRSG